MFSKLPITNYQLPENGQSILEIVISLAIFVIIVSSLVIVVLGSFSGLERGREFIQAGALAAEGIEAVRAIRDRDYNELSYSRSAVSISGGEWVLSGEGTTETIDNFTRTIDFYPVYRDGSNEIVSAGAPGASLDASSTRVLVNINWEIRPGVDDTVERVVYLVDWRE